MLEMQFFCDLHLTANVKNYVYTLADIRACPSSEQARALAGALGQVHARLAEIVAMCPKGQEAASSSSSGK